MHKKKNSKKSKLESKLELEKEELDQDFKKF
jgi:hypothetical protein